MIGLSDSGVFEIEMMQYMWCEAINGWLEYGSGKWEDRSCRRGSIAVGDKTLDVRKSNWSWCVTPTTDGRNGGRVAARADWCGWEKKKSQSGEIEGRKKYRVLPESERSIN